MRVTLKKSIIAVIAAGLAVLLNGCTDKVAKAELPQGYEGLASVAYGKTGSMNGGSYRIELHKNVGKDLLTITKKESANTKEKTTQVEVGAEAVDDLAKMLEKYHPEEWADYPQGDKIALDSGTSSVTVTYSDGKNYTLYGYAETPEYEDDVFFKIRTYLDSYAVNNPNNARIVHYTYEGGSKMILEIEEPEYVRVEQYTRENNRNCVNGAAYDIVFDIYGRIPGETIVTTRETGEYGEVTRYRLIIDDDYNVTSEQLN